MKIAIWHNILWARYKAAVFSSVYRAAVANQLDVTFYQIAETEVERLGLSPIDLTWHQYPYELLFYGSYSNILKTNLVFKLFKYSFNTTADLTILTGYEKPEIWLQALVLTLRRRRFAFFCDSTIYDQPQTFLKGIAKRIFFNWADGAFCYGVRAAEYLTHYGVNNDKIFKRCQAAALPRNYTPEKAIEQRISTAPTADSPNFLYVGRLSSEKSLDHLIKAFATVVGTQPCAKLTLIGSGPELMSLRSLSAELSIDNNVTFSGSKYDEDLFAEYSKATCLILPSQSEPWGLVVNEALSYGCPAIVSHRCGCVPELVGDHKTGFVFDWGNIGELTEKMMAALDTFSDVEVTARECLTRIAPFTPESAAKSILDGCAKIIQLDCRSAS